jgi:membrane-bound metal-dependent hydrolase YbcI (DUF457 family)
MIFAGTLADLDLLSAFFGPAAYFDFRRTYTHSLLGTLAVVILALLFTACLDRKRPEKIPSLLVPLSAAAALHLALDFFQSEGVALLCPFQPTRFALNWLPSIDPWILAILIAGIFFPEVLRLVTSEIGAKSKSPRGRNGAVIALSFIALLIAARAILHSGSVASLEPNSYQGQSARQIASYPDALSLFTWHGVVETESLLCTANVPAGISRRFDAESAECLHKPEPSPELTAATKTRVAQKYLRVEPFPRATVTKTEDGYEVVLRSMRDLAQDESHHRIAAEIHLNSNSEIASQELVWVADVQVR